MYRYEVIVYWSQDDQAYIAEAPELPGCMAHGETYAAAVASWMSIAAMMYTPTFDIFPQSTFFLFVIVFSSGEYRLDCFTGLFCQRPIL